MTDIENIITEPIEDDIETMLPDGWAEGDDIFADGEWTGKDQADESDTDPVQEPEEGDVEETDDTAPTTEQDTDSDDNGETQAEAPTPEQTTEEKPNTKHKFKATFDREEREVEVDLETEVPTLWQKAQVTDRVQAKLAKMSPVYERGERLSRSLGYESFEAMLNSAEENYVNSEVNRLKAEGANEEMAKDYVARKMASVAERKPEPEPETVEQPAAPNGAQTRDIRTEIATLFQVRPDLTGKQVPREVLDAARAGKHILAAYTEWEIQQAKAEATKLRKENEIYKQNAASAAKAPVKGVSGGGATGTKAKDPFEEGFDSDDF
jgi:hypothetical protein